MLMRKCLEILIILASTSFSASGQTPEACRDQLRHFSVPIYKPAFSILALGGRKFPNTLLFSQNGIEVYADSFPAPKVELPEQGMGIYENNFINGRDFLNQVSVAGMEVLIVYQDEAVRQAMIKQLREKHALPPPGVGALVDNLKYAKLRFLPDSWSLFSSVGVDKPFPEKWHVAHLEYDQPDECMNRNDIHQSFGDPYDHGKLITFTDERIEVDSQPFWSKTFQAMLAWVKQCASLVDKSERPTSLQP